MGSGEVFLASPLLAQEFSVNNANIVKIVNLDSILLVI
tara:strand:+ start:1041 stop:1154 length:114 start_codon:yes stop_codon:yes gene_type:complete